MRNPPWHPATRPSPQYGHDSRTHSGQIDEAIAGYHSALEVYPEHMPTVQALARCQLRNNRTDEDTARYLEIIAMRGDEQWREWARKLRIPITGQP